MLKCRIAPIAALATTSVFVMVISGVIAAHDATPAVRDMARGVAHPAHIHSGTCDTLGDAVFPLMEATLPERTMASPEATPDINLVAESITTVDVAPDDILAAEHAINVHLSADEIDVYIACGDITGEPGGGLLDVNLEELNGSGYTGQATLLANEDDSTTVTVTIVETALGTPVATPAS